MIKITNLTVSYRKKEKVISSLNLSIQNSTINGIVGLNGSGKTTLLNTIFGLLKYKDGEITYEDEKVAKKHISYLPAENFFYSYITGREYLKIFKADNFDENKWNKLFLLPLDQIIDEYSTGMKKKLSLLGILKQNKPIMILDEPFNGLDIETARIMRSILLKLKEKGKTIIITSHIIETLTNLCDYIHFLDSGKIKYSKEKYEFSEFEKTLFENIEKKNEGLINELTK